MSNVGTIDRIVRAIAGLALIIIPFLAAWPIVAVVASVAVGIVLVTTASISFCPIYAALGISSKVNQGFSGDGEALKSARRPLEADLVERAKARVSAGGRFSVADLGRELQVPEGVAGELVDLLSEQGLLGYDLPEGTFYSRHLPFVARGFKAQAREVNSRRVAEEGRAEVDGREALPDGQRLSGWVQGDHATYRVHATLGGDGAIRDGSCTCPWYLQHGMGRGPCKHILALRLAGAEA